MTGAELQATWFSPFAYIVYLGLPFVLMIAYYEWKWAKVCKENIQVLIAQQGGGGEFRLAPKVGGEVSITNPNNNTIRTWPINELSTIDVLYPGVGFIPAFLQKTIRLAIVNEGDWEPMLNRSPHRDLIASPDIVSFLQSIADNNPDTSLATEINNKIAKIATGPTREMIASPAVLGNLLHEKITEVVMTVNKEIIDTLSGLVRKLDRIVSPTMFYICIGIVIIGLIFNIVMTNGLKSKMEGIDRIQNALGITVPADSGGGFPQFQNPLAPKK